MYGSNVMEVVTDLFFCIISYICEMDDQKQVFVAVTECIDVNLIILNKLTKLM